MGDIILEVINGQAGLYVSDPDDPTENEDLMRLAEIFEDLMGRFDLGFYDLDGQSVYDYLCEELREGWICMCVTNTESTTKILVGCKPGYFTDGDGKGLPVYSVFDFINSYEIVEENEISGSDFEQILCGG